MITIYNKKDGKQKTVDPVDAREHVNTGNWTYNDDASDEEQSIAASQADLEQLRGEIHRTREDLQISEEQRLKALKDLGDVEGEFEKSESELSRSRTTIVRLEKALADCQDELTEVKEELEEAKAKLAAKPKAPITTPAPAK